MRKSWVRFVLASSGVYILAGQASAQSSVQFWLNSFGDAATNQPSVINVVSGTTARLSVYLHTSNVGPLSGISVMLGYSTTSTFGPSATPDNTFATFNAFNWAQSDLAADQAAGAGTGGGAGAGTRPFGYTAASLNVANTFSGTGDGVDFHVCDITLNINAAAGTDIPVSVWSFGTSDLYATAIVNGNSTEYFPNSPYNATLHVVPVPEPASLAVLGLGALAFVRRRRSR